MSSDPGSVPHPLPPPHPSAPEPANPSGTPPAATSPCGHSTPGCHHPAPAPESLADLTLRLRRGERRLTGPRQAILAVLREGARPLSSKEIHRALPGGECDLVTVYRSLHMLEQLRMVQRYDLGDGVARFELQPADGHHHHHHLVCRQCATVVELAECDLEGFEHRVATRSGFAGVSHRLEFFGVCPRCQ